MTDSAFNRSLDALVRGESIGGNDDLTRFAADLYRREHDVMMPASVKSSIAARLGLEPGVEAAHAAPISQRTARANAVPREYARRPWSIAAAIVIAVSLAFTGILQWSLPSGNDGDRDSRFGVLSPAIPTVDATPSASPMAKCTVGNAFDPDYEVHADDPVILRPGPGIGSGDPLDVLPVGTQVMYLCEMIPTSDPDKDELDEGQMWLKFRTEMGVTGWMREINVTPTRESLTPTAESTIVPMGGDNRVTPVPTASLSNDIVPMESNDYATSAPTSGDDSGSLTPTPAAGGVEIRPMPTPSG